MEYAKPRTPEHSNPRPLFTIDAHLDLSMNAMEWNRDLRRSVAEINAREAGLNDKPDRGQGTVSLPELRKGNVGLVVATQIARFVAPDNPLPGWHSPEQAWAHTQAQLAWYQAMVAVGEMVQIRDLPGLELHLAHWGEGNVTEQQPIGFILSLEGADSLVSLEHLEMAHAYGLRAIGPAHYGPGRYANGTDSTGKMGQMGIDLLKKMESLNIILDATHLCDDAFWQAISTSMYLFPSLKLVEVECNQDKTNLIIAISRAI
jgi:membrane dipeptidase